jgi:hypothetical protein
MKRKPLTPDEKARACQNAKDFAALIVMALIALKVADLLTKF